LDSALGKGIRVLVGLAEAQGPVRLSALATQLNLQKSAVHRILQTWIEAGFAAKNEDTGLYWATFKLWELGVGVVNALPIKQAATTVLQELHRRTGETVSLSILDGDEVLYLDKLLSPRPMGFTTRVGSRRPAPFTVAGRAMLAYADDAQAVVERVLASHDTKTVTVKKVMADLQRSREQGFLVGEGRTERGIVGIAAAVPGPDGRAAAGITVSSPKQRLTPKAQQDIIEALMVAASRLSEAVGGA
jgi:IclR family transcriptional regulator, KDG regulon repressor